MGKEKSEQKAREDLRFSHIVLYKTNPKNLDAAKMIVKNADKYLKVAPGLVAYHCAPIADMGRAVTGNSYNVMLNMIFRNKQDYMNYMKDPRHIKFVNFVLNGFMLSDTDKTTPKTKKEEFIDYILKGNSNEKRKWARDPEVPESEIVWDGEVVYDAGGK